MSIVKSYSFPDGEIRGDMYYIKHGTNNFTVIDCYLKDGNDKNARKEEIVAEIKMSRLVEHVVSYQRIQITTTLLVSIT